MERGLVVVCEPGDEITPWQRLRLSSTRYFPHINWSITGKCNFNCLHCFMAADNAPMMDEFTWEECLALLDEVEYAGIQTITLTGGEPMLHPHFMDLCREIATSSASWASTLRSRSATTAWGTTTGCATARAPKSLHGAPSSFAMRMASAPVRRRTSTAATSTACTTQ